MSDESYVWTISDFSGAASALRRSFEKRFDLREGLTSPKRFVWEYFHIPNQYRFLRTPAWEFFPSRLYREFHEELVRYGRRELGCHDVSPVWLSAYVDGAYQRWHRDAPHGAWAFVFSLSPRSRRFRGGETVVRLNGKAQKTIRPNFNQLVVFDPRLEHHVRTVQGIEALNSGRVVMHGWFSNPRPYVAGSLKPQALARKIPELLETLDGLRDLRGVEGFFVFRFDIRRERGKYRTTNIDILPSPLTLKGRVLSKRAEAQVFVAKRSMVRTIARWVFDHGAGSQITLPIGIQ